ncbi:MAG TPA: hypothetical protein VKE88_01610 [Candidatus Nanoarchaeia archaeon]|nr:hypothetical protein [Candidatus Nanoarchaeia archaeon]
MAIDIREDVLITLENDIKRISAEIEVGLNCNGFLFLVYNPLELGGEIIEGDSRHIYDFLNGLSFRQATILLHGPGGDFKEGLVITYAFRKKFLTYRSFVPGICSSALCLPVLKSDGLIILKDGTITQLDPIFDYEGKPKRAIKHLKDETDSVLREKANAIFQYSRNEIFKLIETKPSLYDEGKGELDYVIKTDIINSMMNQNEHSDDVKPIAFEYLPFKVEFKSDEALRKSCDELINSIQQYLIMTGRRYCIGTTAKTTMNAHLKDKKMEGSLLFCP